MISKIEKYDLCLGCGLCSSVLGTNKVRMEIGEDGFYKPSIIQNLEKCENELIKDLCPGIHVESQKSKGAWGSMNSICEAWSCDYTIRHKAASGGVVSSLAIFMLEQKLVDAVLQVGVVSSNYLYNELQLSRTKEDVLCKAQSRYAPALVLHNLKQILDSSSDIYAFVGKPCDIAGVKNFLKLFPDYTPRFKYFISIFCAGMPSYKATEMVWKLSGHKDEPVSLKYRGDGWPGDFRACFSDDSIFSLSYSESWGKILGRQLGFRCKICPDGIGMLADISVGDSWNTQNGYPDFSESEGRCFCMVRTNLGSELMDSAVIHKYIERQFFDINKVKEQQAYQYNRRKLVGWRLFPVQLVTLGLLNFKNLGIFGNTVNANYKEGFKNLIGTFKRLRKFL